MQASYHYCSIIINIAISLSNKKYFRSEEHENAVQYDAMEHARKVLDQPEGLTEALLAA